MNKDPEDIVKYVIVFEDKEMKQLLHLLEFIDMSKRIDCDKERTLAFLQKNSIGLFDYINVQVKEY